MDLSIKRKAAALLPALAFSASTFAGTMGPIEPPMVSPVEHWHLTFLASLGYTGYNSSYGGQGETALGRFAAWIDVYHMQSFKVTSNDANYFSPSLGFEIGVQSGHTMPIEASDAEIEVMGGLPIATTIEPMIDFLATLTINNSKNPYTFGIAKAGVALRRWQIGRNTIPNVYQAAGEVQAGLGLRFTKHSTASLLYQGVFGGSPNLRINVPARLGTVDNIPIQNGILLTLSATV